MRPITSFRSRQFPESYHVHSDIEALQLFADDLL